MAKVVKKTSIEKGSGKTVKAGAPAKQAPRTARKTAASKSAASGAMPVPRAAKAAPAKAAKAGPAAVVTQAERPLPAAGPKGVYDESKIKTLSSLEHIRLRTGMYIGRLGDGSNPDDGIYVLLKEIIDNGVDEFIMGNGKHIEVAVTDGTA
jgi:topoisomerase-4 subunit B